MKAFPYGVKSPHEMSETAVCVLNEYMAITAGIGIRACIILGACLGLYRDHEFPIGDNDIDVVAVVGDRLDRAFLTKRLIAAGFLMGRSYPAMNTHFVKDGILLDVYWRKADGFYAEFGSAEYGGIQYPIPARIDEYLTRCYGDWKTLEPDRGSEYEG